MSDEAGCDRWRGPASPLAISELADHDAVGRLVKIYALGMDMRDYELCRSAFAPDALAEGRGGEMIAIDAYLPELYAGAAAFQATQHNITNQYVAVTGDEAVVWSYAVAFHKPAPGDARQTITVGVQYRDRCRRGPRGWLIAERRTLRQWTEFAENKTP